MDKSALPPLRLLGVILPVCVAGLGVTVTAAVSFAVLPIVRDSYGYAIAFLCPAVLMGISFVLFEWK